MERSDLIATAEAYAAELGWQIVEVEDTGMTVTMLLSAPGASEQMVDAPLSRLRKALKELGGPEDYSEIEEYDLDEPETVAAGEEEHEQETVYVEQAETQEEFDAALKEARLDQATDPTILPDPEPEYDTEWADRCEQGPSLKELHRALEGAGDIGPDGIPRPEQLVPAPTEEEDLMPGGKIVARRGEEVMRFGFAIRPQVKAALEASGWSFTHVVAAARGDKAVAIERSGRVTIQNVNGRLVRSAGGLLTVSKGDRSFQAKSVSVDYAKAGWLIQ